VGIDRDQTTTMLRPRSEIVAAAMATAATDRWKDGEKERIDRRLAS
jgi:hypothetical protein